jgi:competence protein ComEC
MGSPVILSAAAFACGIVALQNFAALPAHSLVLAAIAAVALGCAGSLAKRRVSVAARCAASCALCSAAALLGFAYAAWRAEARLADALPLQWESVDVTVVGIVDELPQVLAGRGVRFAFAVEDTPTPGATVPARISLAWPTGHGGAEVAAAAPEVHAGERWRFVVRLKRPHGNVNPAGFDLEAWLLERNLRATGYVRAHPANARIAAFAGRPADHVNRAREAVRTRIFAALPARPYAGVLVALAIGDQRSIPEPQWSTFNRTGVAHLVSISGLHVTVFATVAAALAFALARHCVRVTARMPARKLAAAAGVLFAFAYVQLAGAEVPALRTFVMLAVGALGLWLGRPGTAAPVWLWSLVAVLLWDPWASLAPGLWLSFGAVGLLLYAGAGRLRRAPARGAHARVRLLIAEGARTQWIVTLGLLPATLALFQQVSLVSAVANAIAIPAVTLAIVPCTLLGIALPFDAVWWAAHALLAALMAVLEGLATLPSAVWTQHAPVPWCVGAAMAGVLLVLAPRGLPGRAHGLVWMLPLFVVVPAPPSEGGVRVTVLDVGQGLAVLVRTSRHALLYDAGPRFGGDADAGGRVVAPFLRAAGIRALDALVVSHRDLDHAGGALTLMQTVPVGAFWSSLPFDHPIVTRAAAQGSVWRCMAGQRWDWDGVRFTVLYPPVDHFSLPDIKANDRSCVVRVESAYGNVLLTGDIEAPSESWLLDERVADLRADILVVPHHGSRTSSTPAFVAAVAPRVAIFTVGYRNRFGHPRPDVVARYAGGGAALFRSDRHGAVTIDLGPGNAGVPVAERDRRRRYWQGDWRSRRRRIERDERSVDKAPQAHRRLALSRPAGRHDQHAVVVRSADLHIAVACEQRAALRDDLQSARFVNELESCARDGDDVGDLDRPLPRQRRRVEPRVQQCLRRHAEMAQEPQRSLHRDAGRRRFPVLAAFDQQRAARVVGVVEERVVAQPAARFMSGIDDDVLRQPHVVRQRDAFRLPPGEGQRRTGIGHRVQIEQVIGRVVAGPQGAGARQLARRPWRVEHVGRPQPVEVLVEAARRVGVGRVERPIGVDVGKDESQRAAGRAQARREQLGQRDRAADFVAVRERLQREARSGALPDVAPDVGKARVSRGPARQVRERDADRRRLGGGHRPSGTRDRRFSRRRYGRRAGA